MKEFVVYTLLLEAGLIGVFLALDLFLFFVFFEAILIPMYFIIGIWGGERRVYAAIKFFLYTAFGSALMLAAIIALAVLDQRQTGVPSFAYTELFDLSLNPTTARWLFAAFALAFAIKVPMFPLHTWLPDAHVEAPTAGSVLLAAMLLKLGTYGLRALQPRALPAGLGRLRSGPGGPGRDRDRLRGGGGDRPARPEEARRLLLGLPPRLHRPREPLPSPPEAWPGEWSRTSTTGSPPVRFSSWSA